MLSESPQGLILLRPKTRLDVADEVRRTSRRLLAIALSVEPLELSEKWLRSGRTFQDLGRLSAAFLVSIRHRASSSLAVSARTCAGRDARNCRSFVMLTSGIPAR